MLGDKEARRGWGNCCKYRYPGMTLDTHLSGDDTGIRKPILFHKILHDFIAFKRLLSL